MYKPNLEKFKNYKFGMFIHWGLYSMRGNDCWDVMFSKDSMQEYIDSTLPYFDGKNCNMDEWAELAKKVGMKYMVFTARHHDGFSLWDSKSSWGNHTSMSDKCPVKRDYVKEFTDACRKQGLGVGIYYSPIDWRFPGFYNPQMFKENAREMVKQCHEQVDELTKNYGDVDVLWFDGGEDWVVAFSLDFGSRKRPDDCAENPKFPNFWEEDKLNDIFRTNQPEIVATPRFGSMKHGDIKVYECAVNNYDVENVWETCERIAHCWGWTPETQPRSLRDLVKLLIKVITGGGNLLHNVGPDGSGKMDEKQVRRLLELGDFVNKHEESIFNTDAGPIVNGNYGGTTHNKNSVYLHVTDWKCEEASFPTLNEKVVSVECLTTNDEFKYREENGVLYMNIAEKSKGDPDTIFKITFEKDVKVIFKDFDAKSFKIDTPYVDRFTEINGR